MTDDGVLSELGVDYSKLTPEELARLKEQGTEDTKAWRKMTAERQRKGFFATKLAWSQKSAAGVKQRAINTAIRLSEKQGRRQKISRLNRDIVRESCLGAGVTSTSIHANGHMDKLYAATLSARQMVNGLRSQARKRKQQQLVTQTYIYVARGTSKGEWDCWKPCVD